MPQYIKVGEDVVEFPDEMSDADIERVLAANAPQPAAPQPAAPPAAPVEPDFNPGGDIDPSMQQIPQADPNSKPISRQTLYGMGGGLVGGLVGAAGGPGTAFVASGAASALGTYLGAFEDAKAGGKSDAEARDHATRQAALDVGFSLAGGLVFKIGGKAISLSAKLPAVQALARKLGLVDAVAPAPTVAKGAEAATPGHKIFPETTAEQAKVSAQDAATMVQQRAAAEGRPGISSGQMTNKPSWMEKQAATSNQEFLQGVEKGNADSLQRAVGETRDQMAGRDMSGELAREETGKKYASFTRDVEDTVKNKHRATFELLSDPNSPLGAAARIDNTPFLDAIERELSVATDPTIRATLENMRRLLGEPGSGINLMRANDFIKSWGAAAAHEVDPAKGAASPLGAVYSRFSGDMRRAFDRALDRAIASGQVPPSLRGRIAEAKREYKTMQDTLYGDTGSKLTKLAETNPEQLLTVLTRPGNTTAVQDFKNIVRLAHSNPQTTTGMMAAAKARETLREVRAQYLQKLMPDAKSMATLGERLAKDKGLQDQFRLFFPESLTNYRGVIEKFGQAAQQIERHAGAGGTNTGIVLGQSMAAGAAVGGGLMSLIMPGVGTGVGALVGAGVGAATSYKAKQAFAHMMTKPTLVAKLPAVANFANAYAAALGKGTAVAQALKVPRVVEEFMAEMKADGFVDEPAAAAPAPTAQSKFGSFRGDKDATPTEFPESAKDDMVAEAIKRQGMGKHADMIMSVYHQESTSGAAKTRRPNASGAIGPMQVTKVAFDDMKQRGFIPKDYDWENPAHSTEAGVAYLKYAMNRFGGDAAKAAAFYFGGPGAVKDGEIQGHRRQPDGKSVKSYVGDVVGRL